MVLAMAVLLFQFPAAVAPANAFNGPTNATTATPATAPVNSNTRAVSATGAAFTVALSSKGPLGPHQLAISFSAASTSNPKTYALAAAPDDASRPVAIHPASTKADDAPVAQPIIHSFQPPVTSLGALTGAPMSEVILPPPGGFRPPNELPVTHRGMWLALTTVEHSAATYDAWSTRRALAAGRIEADPLMRPFAGSAALYPVMQVVPFGLDYLAHRLQRSSGWAHRIWWVPQSAATVTFLFSGSYNVAHTN